MKTKKIKLPSVEHFACSPQQAKAAFGEEAREWASFGNPIRTFRFDSRARRVPALSGPAVASVTITRQGGAYLVRVPGSSDAYSDAAAENFVESVLPRLAHWLAEMRARPATAVVGIEQAVVEWSRADHVIHNLTYL